MKMLYAFLVASLCFNSCTSAGGKGVKNQLDTTFVNNTVVEVFPEAPIVRYSPIVAYSDAMRKAGEKGDVFVEGVIDTSGKVLEVRIVKSSNEKLNDLAKRLARQYIFEPLVKNGRGTSFKAIWKIELNAKEAE